MPVQENREASLIQLHLTEAHSKAESGDFGGALEEVREAKSLEPKNVYILAFEKQTEQLQELASTNSLTDDQRADILESLPSIIERAVESPVTPEKAGQPGTVKPTVDAQHEKLEKAAALDWLKNQYFQHAHEYIRKSEFQHALAEIRRVYIIDPDNKSARDFEKQITELSKLRPDQRPKSQVDLLGTSPPKPIPAAANPLGDADSTPMMTEEWSSPQQLLRQPPKSASRSAPKKRKGNSILIFFIFVAFVGLVLALLWYYQRNILSRKPAEKPSLPPPAAEQYLRSAPRTAERSYVVSTAARQGEEGEVGVTELAAGSPISETDGQLHPDSDTGLDAGAPVTRPSDGGGALSAGQSEQNERGTGSPLMASQRAPAESSPTRFNRAAFDSQTPARFVAVQKEARIVKLNKPKFSSALPAGMLDGQVVIQVQIDTLGKPIQTLTLKATNDLLIQPVIDAVMSSKYAPAEMSTGPVISWLTIPFKFVH
jgi:tetratricopeptide (TPR) repeat protein